MQAISMGETRYTSSEYRFSTAACQRVQANHELEMRNTVHQIRVSCRRRHFFVFVRELTASSVVTVYCMSDILTSWPHFDSRGGMRLSVLTTTPCVRHDLTGVTNSFPLCSSSTGNLDHAPRGSEAGHGSRRPFPNTARRARSAPPAERLYQYRPRSKHGERGGRCRNHHSRSRGGRNGRTSRTPSVDRADTKRRD